MATSADYRRAARRAAQIYDLPFFPRQIRTESGFRDVVSPAGAQGPAQLMPDTARGLGVNPHTARAIYAAAKLVRSYVDQFGNVEDALRAYNAGPGKVQASHGYAETNAYVKRILGGGSGGTGPRRGGGRSGGGGLGGTSSRFVPGVSAVSGLPESNTDVLTLLKALEAQRPAVPSGSLPAPAYAAHAALPAGAQIPESGGGPAPKPDYDALLAQIQTSGGGVQGTPGNAGGLIQTTVPTVPGVGQLGVNVAGRKGRVVVDPNADRAGVRTHGYVIKALQRVSAIAGTPVRLGTGSNHSRLTVNGNVSDHWTGDAGDVPATGRRLIRLGQAALIDAGMPPAQARKQTGGLFNVNGAQIIFNTQEGGDHTNHLHYHPARRR